MIHAYDESYLRVARENLANMLQFAVYDLKKDITTFYNDFIGCGMAERFGAGESKVVAGMSGVELTYEVLRRTTGEECKIKPAFRVDKTPEYWAGWALAYYQWDKNIPFDRINEAIPIHEVVDLYHPYHEADIVKFVEVIDETMKKKQEQSRLARLRAYAGMTQKMLAEKSGVSVRMIASYEQGAKELSKASAETVFRLANALHCEMEDLVI